ncbi:MAG: hypothetical protein QN157_04475 [Armatimonadota bacterium]|nr:hypothetical protein [Armatimonadota bacterium]
MATSTPPGDLTSGAGYGRSRALGWDDRVAVAVELAERWLLHSGICVPGHASAHAGAVYSYYDTRARAHVLLYAEAVGYLLSLCKYLRHLGRAGDWAALGRAGGAWLLSLAARPRPALIMGVQDGARIDQVYAFDNGVCCKGLLDLYEMTGVPAYREHATRLADWLVREALNDDGSVKPVLDLPSGRFLENRRAWFMVSGSFQAKIAIPLLQLATSGGEDYLRRAAARLCQWATAQQRSDGSFPANRTTARVNLHAHLYTVEALLVAYALEGWKEFLTAAERAVAWVLVRQRPDGSIPLWTGGWWTPTATYAVAQAVRVFLLLDLVRPAARLRDAAAAGAQFLLQMQARSQDPGADGGFYEERLFAGGLRFRTSPRVTSWATMFAVQALHLVRDRPARFEDAVKALF